METTMNTFSQGSSASAPGVAPSSEQSDLFTRLLVAQIRNQDPLSPSDPSQFVNQLSQLSQTEALQKLASLQAEHASALQQLQVLALGAQVGADVSVAVNRVRLDRQPLAGSFELPASYRDAAVLLTGADGVTHRVELGPRAAGRVEFSLDPQAGGLPPGFYKISADGGNGVQPAVDLRARLMSVRLTGGEPVLQLAGLGDLPASSVIAYHGATTSASISNPGDTP